MAKSSSYTDVVVVVVVGPKTVNRMSLRFYPITLQTKNSSTCFTTVWTRVLLKQQKKAAEGKYPGDRNARPQQQPPVTLRYVPADLLVIFIS